MAKKEKKERILGEEAIKQVTIELITPQLGTVAKDPKLYEDWIQSKKPPAIVEDETLTIDREEGMELKGWTGFHKDKNGLFIYDYMVKGFIKHAGNVNKDILGIAALKSKIDDYLFISPRRIHLGKMEPDGCLERPIRVMTPQGPRVSLMRSDYVNRGVILTFSVMLLQHHELRWGVIERIFDHGRLMGLGQWRNGSYGRFVVKSIDDIPEEEAAKLDWGESYSYGEA